MPLQDSAGMRKVLCMASCPLQNVKSDFITFANARKTLKSVCNTKCTNNSKERASFLIFLLPTNCSYGTENLIITAHRKCINCNEMYLTEKIIAPQNKD